MTAYTSLKNVYFANNADGKAQSGAANPNNVRDKDNEMSFWGLHGQSLKALRNSDSSFEISTNRHRVPLSRVGWLRSIIEED